MAEEKRNSSKDLTKLECCIVASRNYRIPQSCFLPVFINFVHRVAQKSLDVEKQKGRVQRLQRHYVCMLEQLSLLSDYAKECRFKDSAFSSIYLEQKLFYTPRSQSLHKLLILCAEGSISSELNRSERLADHILFIDKKINNP